MPLDSLKFRQWLTLESQTTTQNSENGEKTSVWTLEDRVYGDIATATGRELSIANGFKATTNSVITIRYRADVNSTWRVTYRGRVFNIDGVVDPDERNAELKLYCTEVKQ